MLTISLKLQHLLPPLLELLTLVLHMLLELRSMRGEPATLAKQMATVLLRSFTSSDRVAVLQYNGTEATALGPHGLELVPALAAFTDDIAASIASIDPYKMRGRSYISSALEEGYVESMRLICTTSLTSVRPRVHASTHRRLQHSTR